MKILGIETSCDETAASVVEKKNGRFKVLSSAVASQILIHRKTGGVVPEVAAREHVKNILSVIDQALRKAKIKPKDIDRIAVTFGPGLLVALLVGTETAKTLAYLWKKPIIPVNHLEGHIAASYLLNKKMKYPALTLLVSGGHTELVLMRKPGNFRRIGSTRDDAAGECFDKCAKLLGYPYPGGPEISRLAEKAKQSVLFPRPMMYTKDFDFSFSGLKTSVLYYTQKKKRFSSQEKWQIARGVEEAIVDVLLYKTKRATEKYKTKTVILCGGVAANPLLRKTFLKHFKNFLVPEFQYCTDNAAMIATAAFGKNPVPWQKIHVDPNLNF